MNMETKNYMNMETKKLLGYVNLHSTIDLITNSSTEIFCVVGGKSKDQIKEVVNKIISDFGCHCIMNGDGLEIEDYIRWDDESGKEIKEEGKFSIWYDRNYPPCNMIKQKLGEVFTIEEVNE